MEEPIAALVALLARDDVPAPDVETTRPRGRPYGVGHAVWKIAIGSGASESEECVHLQCCRRHYGEVWFAAANDYV
ncbi:hypothetical protein AAFF_G00259530 [Aldrovandia affinis]|uniref:Uncharacterized protein n=1 Tax=Aldrovandia affinis TaxID=143900 RepID=A0AAD7RCE1_9TELE|nr:hypothetical protein AAFF_G00259530 [Aldrovandia affinis]